MVELTRTEAMKHRVLVQTELADGLPLLHGDRIQLQQVILNLVVNAVEVMSAHEGERQLLIATGIADTGDVLVTVRDSGPGLAPATLNHIFDAFHTSKPSGLGMGLSICRSIVEAHGGFITADNGGIDGCARFSFTLPTAGSTA